MEKSKFLISLTIFIFLENIVIATNQCTTGTYYNELTSQCENCAENCSQCKGYQQIDCLECSASYYKIQLDNHFFCAQCPQGQYYDNNTKTCTNCNFDCDICLTSTTCLVCKVGYILDSITSKNCNSTNCQYGYYRNPITKLCEICPASSYFLDCGYNITQMVGGVITKFTLYPKKCFDTFQISSNACNCLIGVYLSKDKCEKCADPNCFTCSATDCTMCQAGYYLLNGRCVTKCDQLTYYYQAGPKLSYRCVNFPPNNPGQYQINQLNGEYVCNQWNTYEDNFGCFSYSCRPFQFKLFNSLSNSYKCVEACPIGTTGNLQTTACIQNSCQDDISVQINGQCFHRTCPLGQQFQSFQNYNTKSTCKNLNIPNCLYQQDESQYCLKCKPGYFDSQCLSNCSSTTFYYQNNGCYSCSNTACETTNFKYKYTVNNVDYWANSCPPEGYYLSGTRCIRCSDPKMIFCDPAGVTRYACDWGEDNTSISCAAIDLSTLQDQAFDSQGSVISITTSCTTKDSVNQQFCSICSSSYNYNFKGICSQLFIRSTKYYIYYNITESQYHVLESCSTNQFVQKVFINNIYMKVCKDFATCLVPKTIIINGVSKKICDQCSDNFFNLNGTCIDDCPTYTYKNKTTKKCEAPIENCSQYLTGQTTPLCTTCKPGFIKYKSQQATACIAFSDCKDGYYYQIQNDICNQCQAGCSVCDFTGKCITPTTGYNLYNEYAISICPNNTFKDLTSNTCKNCSQFCKTCSDENTCLSAYTGFQLYEGKAYSYQFPICSQSQYFDDSQKKCINCDPSCNQCYKSATQCLVCSNLKFSLHNYTCVQSCPSSYYTSLVTTTNYSRNICLKCGNECKDQLCQNESNICLNGCADGYYSYMNKCVAICPAGYKIVDNYCELNCKDGYKYDRKMDLCCGSTCKICQQSSCSQCEQDNMYIDPSNQLNCIKTQDKNCIQVNQATGVCQKCQLNYILDNNSQCVCSVSNCSQCSSSDGSACIQCKIGFYLINPTQCCGPQNCQVCSKQNESQCEICDANYKLDSNKQCVFDCQADGCTKCVDNNPKECQICNTNYKLDPNKQCIFDCQVSNCQKCQINNSNNCEICNPNYKLDSNNRCQFVCQVNNCILCDQNNPFQCQKCDSNYQLDQNKNCIISQCKIQNCLTCKNSIPSVCEICEKNFNLDQNSNQCVCQIEHCNLCNADSKCKQCKDNYYYDERAQQCIKQFNVDYNDFELKVTLDFDKYIILLYFQKIIIIEPAFKNDLKQLIRISITKVKADQFNYTIEKMTDQMLKIVIIPLINMKNSDITLNIQLEQFIQENKLMKQQETKQLQPFVKITDLEKQKSDQVSSAAKSVTESYIYIIIPTIIMGNAYLVCNTLDITGFLYYFPFLNIRLPYNVISFYEIFKDFSFPFIPNMFLSVINPNYTQVSPTKFMEFNTDNYFISNAGQSFTVVLSVFTLYVLAKIFSYTPIIYIGPYCKRVVNETWEFGGLIDLAWSFYIYIIVGIFMQLNTINFDDENSAFLNYAFHAFCSMIYLGIPLLLGTLIYKNKNLKDDKISQQKLSSILNGLKLYNEREGGQNIYRRKMLSKYYSIVLYVRKIIFCVIIVWLYDYVYIQLALFSIMNTGVISYLVLVTPFEQKIEQAKNIIQELIMIIIQICCAWLVEDNESQEETERINIGWIIVSLSGFIIVWYTFYALKDLIIGLLQLFKRIIVGFIASIKNLTKKQKDLPEQSAYKEKNKLNDLEVLKRTSIRQNSRVFLNRYKDSLLSNRQISFNSSILIEWNKKSFRDTSPLQKNRDEEWNNTKFEGETQNKLQN